MAEQTIFFITAGAAILAISGSAAAGIWLHMRRKYISFTEKICKRIDDILEARGTEAFDTEEDTLSSKVEMKLKRLQEITSSAARESEAREAEVQEIISDLSHQLKTPVANIMLYCDTAANPLLAEEKRRKCMEILKQQVSKLDFLVQAMIRMSRLEQNVIALRPGEVSLLRLLERSEQSIRAKAEARGILTDISCREDVRLFCDEKWTAEAILNVLDNAVKYSPPGSRITVRTERLEIYTKIEIADEGPGISPEHVTDVCKRFFREDKAAETEGVGIGLYLTREILEKEKGYLKIYSGKHKGAVIAVYLPNA